TAGAPPSSALRGTLPTAPPRAANAPRGAAGRVGPPRPCSRRLKSGDTPSADPEKPNPADPVDLHGLRVVSARSQTPRPARAWESTRIRCVFDERKPNGT